MVFGQVECCTGQTHRPTPSTCTTSTRRPTAPWSSNLPPTTSASSSWETFSTSPTGAGSTLLQWSSPFIQISHIILQTQEHVHIFTPAECLFFIVSLPPSTGHCSSLARMHKSGGEIMPYSTANFTKLYGISGFNSSEILRGMNFSSSASTSPRH